MRVVRKGYLFPYGHKASLVTVTEREPTQYQNTTGAYLRQKTSSSSPQPIKSYGGSGDFAPFSGRKLPFTSVEALTLITPDLAVADHPVLVDIRAATPRLVFEPVIGTHPVPVPLARHRLGRRPDRLPLAGALGRRHGCLRRPEPGA